jgi:signal transduction histidine kinase
MVLSRINVAAATRVTATTVTLELRPIDGDPESSANLLRSTIRFRLFTELLAPRARILAAQDAERSRIERDPHDGAEQRLANLSLALGVVRTDTIAVPKRQRQAVHVDVSLRCKPSICASQNP